MLSVSGIAFWSVQSHYTIKNYPFSLYRLALLGKLKTIQFQGGIPNRTRQRILKAFCEKSLENRIILTEFMKNPWRNPGRNAWRNLEGNPWKNPRKISETMPERVSGGDLMEFWRKPRRNLGWNLWRKNISKNPERNQCWNPESNPWGSLRKCPGWDLRKNSKRQGPGGNPLRNPCYSWENPGTNKEGSIERTSEGILEKKIPGGIPFKNSGENHEKSLKVLLKNSS